MITILTIFLPYPPSINKAFYTDFEAKTRHKSKEYRDWVKLANQYLMCQRKDYFTGIIKIEYEVYKPDNRKRDLSNLLKVLDDFLVANKIIEDDSKIHDFRMFWSKEEPKAEWHGAKITIYADRN